MRKKVESFCQVGKREVEIYIDVCAKVILAVCRQFIIPVKYSVCTLLSVYMLLVLYIRSTQYIHLHVEIISLLNCYYDICRNLIITQRDDYDIRLNKSSVGCWLSFVSDEMLYYIAKYDSCAPIM